jgi:hypothetical protein
MIYDDNKITKKSFPSESIYNNRVEKLISQGYENKSQTNNSIQLGE